jgi:hypothetical protein
MTDWRDEYRTACRRFAQATGGTWDQWRDAWDEAERVKAGALGTTPRTPRRTAWEKRGGQFGVVGHDKSMSGRERAASPERETIA